ncbi:MAG TPA: class I SAM-dependent methyltransferase [Pseudonocardiaceae bacterium]|jgi:SAM-dependent methyltransferase
MADEVVERALSELAGGRSASALAILKSGHGSPGGELRRQLAEHLATRHHGRVYEEPAAFQAFLDGGGNLRLYEATVARLAAAYRELPARRVLDVGTGDGRAVLAAAASLGDDAPELDLVEPSASLLAQAAAAARSAGLAARTHLGTVQDLLARGTPEQPWDLVEATFALHAIRPPERTAVLAALHDLADAVLIAEFDVPAFDDRGPAHLSYLASRYELGLAEYEGTLVAQGFLMPVLVGQLDPSRPRLTWEQPAAAWMAQLRAAGWDPMAVEPLADYWWAPAIVVTARAR